MMLRYGSIWCLCFCSIIALCYPRLLWYFFCRGKAMFSPWNPDCCIHDGFWDDSWCVPVLRAAKLSGSPPKELCRSILSEFVWFNYHSSLVRPACLVEARAAKKIRTSLAMQRHEQVRELHCQWRMWRKTVDVRWYEGKWHRTCMDRWCWVLILNHIDAYEVSTTTITILVVVDLLSRHTFPWSWQGEELGRVRKSRAAPQDPPSAGPEVVAAVATAPSEGA